MLAIDPELEGVIREFYGRRTYQVLSSMSDIPSRYFFRVNTLKSSRNDVVQSMKTNGLKASLFNEIEDAGFIESQPSTIETTDVTVEADRIAAEAVQLGAHLYATGVKRCHNLKRGMRVTVVDGKETPVGIGVAHQGESSILTYRQGVAVEIEHSRSGLPSLMRTKWYDNGEIHLQSLPAILTGHILDPQPGEVIVDLNCAPGGKTSHICQLTQNKAEIVAFDRNVKKILKTRELMERMGCNNYRLIPQDSRYVHLDYNFEADRVLVDPPCTGLGLVPKLTVETTVRQVRDLSEYQRQFLGAAAKIVKKGGTIVYSVCTVTIEECESVVSFAENRLGLITEKQDLMLGEVGHDENHLTQRFSPDLHEIGYFIARFTKS